MCSAQWNIIKQQWRRLPGCRVFQGSGTVKGGRAVVVYIAEADDETGLAEIDGVLYPVVRSFGPEDGEPLAERWTIGAA